MCCYMLTEFEKGRRYSEMTTILKYSLKMRKGGQDFSQM